MCHAYDTVYDTVQGSGLCKQEQATAHTHGSQHTCTHGVLLPLHVLCMVTCSSAVNLNAEMSDSVSSQAGRARTGLLGFGLLLALLAPGLADAFLDGLPLLPCH